MLVLFARYTQHAITHNGMYSSTEMQIFIAAREVLHNNEQSHNLICVLCVSSSLPYSWEERVYVGLFLPGSFSQQVSSDNGHDMHVLILEKSTLGAGQEDLLVDNTRKLIPG